MTEGRFGHAVVNVAGVVYAVGGDSKNPHHALASIEEFSPGSAEWRLSATKLITPRARGLARHRNKTTFSLPQPFNTLLVLGGAQYLPCAAG